MLDVLVEFDSITPKFFRPCGFTTSPLSKMILVFAFLAILSSAHARCSPWWGSLTCSECVVRKSLFQPCGWILTNPEDTNSGKCGRANGKKGKAAKIIHNLMTTKEMCANLDGVNSAALSISAQVAAEISNSHRRTNEPSGSSDRTEQGEGN